VQYAVDDFAGELEDTRAAALAAIARGSSLLDEQVAETRKQAQFNAEVGAANNVSYNYETREWTQT
jgi:hypothetical protein